MAEKEKNEGTDKISTQITEDEKHILVFDDTNDALICKMSFYDKPFTKEEKKEIGKHIAEGIFSIDKNKEEVFNSRDFERKKEAFKEAYTHENKKDKQSITWLLTHIFGISQEVADAKFEAAKNVMSHPDFADKEDIIIERIYFSDSL